MIFTKIDVTSFGYLKITIIHLLKDNKVFLSSKRVIHPFVTYKIKGEAIFNS